MYDALIIGAGITGASIAMELSKYKLNICWLEKHNDVSMETTKANSGIVHAGYDPKNDTLMAKLNVLGVKIYKELAPKLNFHYKNIGSLVIGSTKEDLESIKELYNRGEKNGVPDMRIINREELLKLEPNIAPEINFALYAPTASIISPWECCLAFSETAVSNGVELHLETEVTKIEKCKGFYRVYANGKTYDAINIFNCAGVYADKIYSMVEPCQNEIKITPIKGEYYLLDKCEGDLVNHVIFQTPTKSGKGVLVSKTVHGNLIVGPNSSHDALNKEDVSNRKENLDYVRETSKKTCQAINFRNNVRNFTGLRASNDLDSDFSIFESKNNKGFFNFAGIKSPGLSCGPAFGIMAKEMLKESGMSMETNLNFEYHPLPKFFKDMNIDEVNALIQKDDRYGRVICRCETVTEGEIVKALHSVIPARTIDGVKRRTNSGMGRCQGGFCGPKILEIIKRELNLKENLIYQDKNNSYIVDEVKEVRNND